MSNFQNIEENVCKKVNLPDNALNSKIFIQILLA